jgi:hypothetical protein
VAVAVALAVAECRWLSGLGTGIAGVETSGKKKKITAKTRRREDAKKEKGEHRIFTELVEVWLEGRVAGIEGRESKPAEKRKK